MLFPYYGPIAELRKELKSIRPRLEKAYADVWGPYFPTIRAAAERYLVPESFDTEAKFGFNQLKDHISNRFVILNGYEKNPKFDGLGGFTPTTMYQAPAFHYSEKAFAQTAPRYERWISPYLGPYIHEMNHFALWAIQKYPFAAVSQLLKEYTGVTQHPFHYSDIPDFVLKTGKTVEERLLKAYLSLWIPQVNDMYERETRVIDYEVYRLLGHRAPRTLQEAPDKRYASLLIPLQENADETKLGDLTTLLSLRPEERSQRMQEAGILVALVAVGDGFKGYSLQERIMRMATWTERVPSIHPVQHAFMQSIKGCTIVRLTVPELLMKEQNEAPESA